MVKSYEAVPEPAPRTMTYADVWPAGTVRVHVSEAPEVLGRQS
jgi:hypothetical protein